MWNPETPTTTTWTKTRPRSMTARTTTSSTTASSPPAGHPRLQHLRRHRDGAEQVLRLDSGLGIGQGGGLHDQ
ncbi:hypothetical protein AAC387_Pa08g1127 [Persea americana]